MSKYEDIVTKYATCDSLSLNPAVDAEEGDDAEEESADKLPLIEAGAFVVIGGIINSV
jgi:hypothetical protein